MKIVLFFSLTLNLVLTYFLVKESKTVKSEAVKTEISKKSVSAVISQDGTELIESNDSKVSTEADSAGSVHGISEDEMSDLIEKVQKDKEEFLTHELNLGQDEISRIQSIKEKSYKKMNALYHNVKDPNSLETRRQVLKIEEDLEKEIIGVLGQKKWNKYKVFREKYNKQSLDGTMKDGPIPYMDL